LSVIDGQPLRITTGFNLSHTLRNDAARNAFHWTFGKVAGVIINKLSERWSGARKGKQQQNLS
jgi:hypothetical protein